MLVQMLQHEATCYYFVLAFNKGDSVDWLPVDAATDYRRDGRVLLSAEEMLEGRRQWNGFWVASPAVELKYLLVKKILKADVPEHAKHRLQELFKSSGKKPSKLQKGSLEKSGVDKQLRGFDQGTGIPLKPISKSRKERSYGSGSDETIESS